MTNGEPAEVARLALLAAVKPPSRSGELRSCSICGCRRVPLSSQAGLEMRGDGTDMLQNAFALDDPDVLQRRGGNIASPIGPALGRAEFLQPRLGRGFSSMQEAAMARGIRRRFPAPEICGLIRSFSKCSSRKLPITIDRKRSVSPSSFLPCPCACLIGNSCSPVSRSFSEAGSGALPSRKGRKRNGARWPGLAPRPALSFPVCGTSPALHRSNAERPGGSLRQRRTPHPAKLPRCSCCRPASREWPYRGANRP